MNNKYFVGQDATSFKAYAKNPPITQIILATDEGAEDAFYAGTEGYSLTVYCPWATQQMANDLLSKAQGFEYQGFEAGMAALPGEAERGDAVTVNGIYGMIADRTLYFNPGMNSDISAPYEEEVNHEFQYVSPIKQEFDRKIGQVQASLTVNIDNIKLEVEDEINQLSSSIDVKLDSITSRVEGLEGEYTELSVTLDGVTIKDASGQTLIKGSSIDTSTIKANSITADKLNLTGAITFGDLSTALQNDINDAYSMAEDAQDVVGGWTYRGTTYIDGSKIMAGTVMASILQGGTVELLDRNEDVSGSISIQPASTSDEAIRFESEGGMALDAMGGTLYLESWGRIMLNPGTEVECQGDFLPGSDDRFPLGASSARWTDVYAVNGTIQTSDANQKNSIEPLPAQYVAMLDQITPKRYKLNDGQSGRYHVGFIAQDVEAAMAAAGITDMEFAGWIRDVDTDGNAVYMLRYNEFMAILLAKIKELEQNLTTLEETS